MSVEADEITTVESDVVSMGATEDDVVVINPEQLNLF